MFEEIEKWGKEQNCHYEVLVSGQNRTGAAGTGRVSFKVARKESMPTKDKCLFAVLKSEEHFLTGTTASNKDAENRC